MNLAQIQRGRGGFPKPPHVYDVGVERIVPRWNIGERLRECAAVQLRMQVPHAIHGGHANHVQVHQVAVIGHEIVGASIEPAGILEGEREPAAFDRRLERERLVHDAAVSGGLGAPPGVAAPNHRTEKHRGRHHRDA